MIALLRWLFLRQPTDEIATPEPALSEVRLLRFARNDRKRRGSQ